MKIRILVFLLLLVATAFTQSDAGRMVDSLLKEIPSAANDTVRARIYNRIFNIYSNTNANKSMHYAKIGLAQVSKMKWSKGIAVFQSNTGLAYSNLGNYDSAKYYYNQALKTQSDLRDIYNMAVTTNSLGTAAQNNQADYTTAATYYFRALQLAESINDTTLQALTMDNISRIYSLQNNYTKALEFGKKALLLREKNATPDELALSLQTLGRIHFSLRNKEEAASNFEKSKAIFESSGNLSGLASAWSDLSLVYDQDPNAILAARTKSKSLWDQVNPLHPQAIANTGNLGLAYFDIVRYDTLKNNSVDVTSRVNKTEYLRKAEENLHLAINLAAQIGDTDDQSFFTGVLAELQAYKGDYKNAYNNFFSFKASQDSIYSQDAKNKIASAESQRELDRKNSEIQIGQLALANQRKTLIGLSVGVLLLAIIGILLYRQNITRRKTNATLQKLNTELDRANKLKAKFFAIFSHDLRTPVVNLINYLHLRKNEPELLSVQQSLQHETKLAAAADALLENMETILLWSKSQMEQLRPQFAEVSTAELFGYLDKQFKNIYPAGLQFSSAQSYDVYTDENCLRTIMYNLTTNAIKAVNNVPHPEVTWDAKQDANQVMLSITDNGTGLDLKMFEDEEARKDSAGNVKSGMGLSIVKDLAKAIDCRIDFVKMKQGTRIELRIRNTNF